MALVTARHRCSETKKEMSFAQKRKKTVGDRGNWELCSRGMAARCTYAHVTASSRRRGHVARARLTVMRRRAAVVFIPPRCPPDVRCCLLLTVRPSARHYRACMSTVPCKLMVVE
jgi:hypothetical protein